jgi:DNA-nicking Smr family endonuclease
MKPKGGTGGKPRSAGTTGLSKDDADLWEHTARSVEPLRRGKARVTAGAPDDVVESRPRISHSGGMPPQTKSTAPEPAPVAPRASSHRPPPPLADIDRRKARKIASGQHDIEARIDLHGLRQVDAHRRLRAFLLGAYSDGLRTVLIITGKGLTRDADDDSGADVTREERGVIRRMVPMWLADADLRAIVVSFTTAHRRHGGSGALYVQLRRRRAR